MIAGTEMHQTVRNPDIEQDGSGVYLIDKPTGPTSFRMVQQVRRILGIKKVGHTGTLDPLASGLLIVCVGRPATKIIPLLMEGEKEYEGTIKLGIETETHDQEGAVTNILPVPDFSQARIAECLASFTGKQLQTPPSYSALKHKGKPLYYYARRGIKVVKDSRLIEISALDLLDVKDDAISIRVACSKGTYIRVLAADIGRALGCGGHLTSLRRTRNGPFSVLESVSGAGLDSQTPPRPLLMKYRLTVAEVKEKLADASPA
jgi:tRNA pseudouridine55 synthase